LYVVQFLVVVQKILQDFFLILVVVHIHLLVEVDRVVILDHGVHEAQTADRKHVLGLVVIFEASFDLVDDGVDGC